MKTNFVYALSAFAAGLTVCASASAQTSATTDPVGYAQISCLANSDTRISIPFTRPAEFTGTISAVSSPAQSATATITVAASPNWANNQFVYAQGTQAKTYYAIIGPNIASMTGTVGVTNGSKAVTGTGTAFLSQVAAGDAILVNGTQATVASVTSDTALTLASNFIGSTVTGASAQSDRSPKEGAYYTVTSNGSNTLTVALNGDSLSSITQPGNTSVTLVPYWTLGSAFPANDAGVSYVASTSTKNRATQILLPNLTGAGTDLTAAQFYFFYQGNWRQAGQDPTVSYDDTVLYPTTYLTLRNTATATTYTPVGAVYMNRLAFALNTLSSGPQDNSVGVPRPANVTLNDLGLVASGGFTPGTSTKNRGDLLFTYPVGQVGYDQTANNFYYYLNGGWRLAGDDATVDYGSTVIPYGVGLTVRKAATANGITSFWQNGRNY